MPTTTSYGTWANVSQYSLDLETSVSEAFGADGPEGFDVDAIVSDYRDAINAALPDGVALAGNEFYGPAYDKDCHFDGYPLNEDGGLDLKAIVDEIDLFAIIERHQLAE
ncbi:hypothetical protein [Amycolatopsis sp. NPDC058986]|uniref:hypothetical protein n=1 Tax=unclassified Amycolatopsis TaxID=2618356 RepID=UPI00366AD5CA